MIRPILDREKSVRPPWRCRRTRRRGSLYVAALTTCLVTSLLAISAVTLTMQHRTTRLRSSQAWAIQHLAQSGLAVALHQIEADPAWREKAKDGAVRFRLEFPEGTCEVEVADPNDQDVTDDVKDPYEIRVTGRIEDSMATASAVYCDTPNEYSSLSYGLYAGGSMQLSGVTVPRGRPLGSNGAITIDTSEIASDLQSGGAISGGVVLGTTRPNYGQLSLPPINTIFRDLEARATRIDYTALGSTEVNYIPNGSFNEPDLHWLNVNELGDSCTLSIASTADNSNRYLSVEARTKTTAGPGFDFTEYVSNGEAYQFRATLACPDGTRPARLYFAIKEKDKAWRYIYSSWRNVNAKWEQVILDAVVSWTTPLEMIRVGVETNSTGRFFVDEAVLGLQLGTRRALSRVVLSATENPFGAVNPEGIYLIDCQNQPLVIERLFLRGTLLLRNPAHLSKLMRGPSRLEPSEAGLPTLVIENSMPSNQYLLESSTGGLIETVFERNLNPVGMPAEDGTWDADLLDRHSGGLRGSFLIDGNVQIVDGFRLAGTLITSGSIRAAGRLEVMPGSRRSSEPASWRIEKNPPRLIAGSHAAQ